MSAEQNRAIPFIGYDKDTKSFTLSKEAEQFLSQIDTKLGVITVVGKYRTGKSFFINRVLLNRQKQGGFPVGPTINPCTKGLWLWNKTLPAENPEHEDMSVLLIDAEGFGGIDENVNHDSRIFLFGLLLSSYFIYNSAGNIDENAIQNLSLIVNLAKEIQIKSQEETAAAQNKSEEDISAHFPGFLWIVRDFALRLQDHTGNPITAKEYLDLALQPQKGMSDVVESKNRVRRLLKHFFKDRDCMTMVRPLQSEKELQRLEEHENEELRPEFVEQMKAIRKKVMKKIKPKTLNGKFVTGPMLLELTRAYLRAVNGGKVPSIESAWQYVCTSESQHAFEEALALLDRRLKEFGENSLTLDQIKSLKAQLREELAQNFKRRAMGSDEELREMTKLLLTSFKKKFGEFRAAILGKVRAEYETFFTVQSQKIKDEIVNSGEIPNYYEFCARFGKIRQDIEV
jgi:hypothetical protein